QVPVGPYVVDFLCVKAQLVVEVDGSQHQTALNHDEARTAWLPARGFPVLRFWNNEVLAQTEGVLEKIRLVLLEPPPYPPPQAGRESNTPQAGREIEHPHPTLPRKRGR